MKHTRQEYRYREGSSVCHFMKECQWFPPLGVWFGNRIHSVLKKPKNKTLCDHCQHLEKRMIREARL
jgi:hypothetical protein